MRVLIDVGKLESQLDSAGPWTLRPHEERRMREEVERAYRHIQLSGKSPSGSLFFDYRSEVHLDGTNELWREDTYELGICDPGDMPIVIGYREDPDDESGFLIVKHLFWKAYRSASDIDDCLEEPSPIAPALDDHI